MSLKIRNLFDPILHESMPGYPDYYVSMNINRYLAIMDNCGKPVHSTPSIEFSSRNPTLGELKQAAELFKKWLTKNTEALERYIIAQEVKLQHPRITSSAYEEKTKFPFNYNWKSSWRGNHICVIEVPPESTDNNTSIDVAVNVNSGKVEHINYSYENEPSVLLATIPAIPYLQIDEMVIQFQKDLKEYAAAERSLNEALAALNASCAT